MSIDEIKDISKLRTMLKSALGELEYIKGCCINAGKELEKHSFAWDGKEKNLGVQAAELNKKYEQSRQALKKIEEIAKEEIVCDNCNLQGTNKCDSRLCTSFYLNDFCKQLLSTINEVLKDE